MKKLIVIICAVAASAAVQAATLADFSNGLGRARFQILYSSNNKVNVVYNDDAIAPSPAKTAKLKIEEKQSGSSFARFNIIFQLKEGEAAAAKALAFDIKVDKPEAVGWVNYYIFRKTWDKNHLLGPGATWRNLKANEWKHFEIPIEKFKSFSDPVTIEEGRQLCISFFCKNAVEFEIANIKFIDK